MSETLDSNLASKIRKIMEKISYRTTPKGVVIEGAEIALDTMTSYRDLRVLWTPSRGVKIVGHLWNNDQMCTLSDRAHIVDESLFIERIDFHKLINLWPECQRKFAEFKDSVDSELSGDFSRWFNSISLY